MKINNSLYPYPVLSSFNDDYIDSKFEVSYNLNEIDGLKTLEARFDCTEPSILQLIEDGHACYFLHIECTQTAFRKILETRKERLEFNIDPKQLRGVVELNSLIVAKDNHLKLNSTQMNPIYEGREFDVEFGDVIAATLTSKLNIEDSLNDFRSMSSIMKVAFSKNEFMEVNTDSDLIYVRLPEKQYNSYVHFAMSKYQNLVLSAVIFPALIHVLNLMPKLLDESESLKWFEVIHGRLLKMNLDVESINNQISSIELAQKILQNPLDRAFEEIRIITEAEENTYED